MMRENRDEIIVHRGHIQHSSLSKISYARTPIISQKYENFSAPSGFVIMFAICSCIATCRLEIIPWSSWSQTCLNLMSMCFVRSLICPNLIRSRAPWLSIRSEVGLVNVMSSELNKDQCQRISLTAVDTAMNSASTVDNDTDVCFLEPYEIAPPSNNTAKPEIDFLSMQSPPQSEST